MPAKPNSDKTKIYGIYHCPECGGEVRDGELPVQIMELKKGSQWSYKKKHTCGCGSPLWEACPRQEDDDRLGREEWFRR